MSHEARFQSRFATIFPRRQIDSPHGNREKTVVLREKKFAKAKFLP
jgi:hypothetical protein